MASDAENTSDALAAVLRERRASLEHGARVYLARADRLDGEIAVLEAAQRLLRPTEDVDFGELLFQAEWTAKLTASKQRRRV